MQPGGLVNNLNDGLAWGLFPLFFAAAGLSVARIGILAALYPAVWGLGQLVTGALSDRIGRKWLIAGGMLVQAAAHRPDRRHRGLRVWAVAPVLLGAGTAMVYPTLLAAIGDVAHPTGGPGPSASTGSGATAGSPSARCSPASSPTPSARRRHLGRRRPHRRLRLVVSCACTRPTPATTAPPCPTTPTSRAETTGGRQSSRGGKPNRANASVSRNAWTRDAIAAELEHLERPRGVAALGVDAVLGERGHPLAGRRGAGSPGSRCPGRGTT